MTNLTEDCHGPTKPVRPARFQTVVIGVVMLLLTSMTQKAAHRGVKLMGNGAAIPAIEVENLWVGYGSVTSVDSVSFVVNEGEQLTLLGPSGCGTGRASSS